MVGVSYRDGDEGWQAGAVTCHLLVPEIWSFQETEHTMTTDCLCFFSVLVLSSWWKHMDNALAWLIYQFLSLKMSQLRYTSTDDWIKKLWHTYHRKDWNPVLYNQMGISGNHRLSEISQFPKGKHHIFSLRSWLLGIGLWFIAPFIRHSCRIVDIFVYCSLTVFF